MALRDVSTTKHTLVLNASDGSDQQQLAPANGQETNHLAPPALAFSPDGTCLFARGKDAVLVWNLDESAPPQSNPKGRSNEVEP